MKRTRAAAFLLLGAVASANWGCIGLDFSRDAVAPAPSQWEYLTVRPDLNTVTLAGASGAQAEPDLARLGEEGWELVAINDGAYVLKRPKQK